MISRVERGMNIIILSLFATSAIVPLLLLLFTAISPKENGAIVPDDLRFSNFVDAWVRSNFGAHLLVSLVLCSVVVGITLLLAPLAAYGLTVLKVPGNRILFPLFLLGVMLPLEGILVPLYYTLRSTPLGGTVWALVTVHVGLSMSFGVFWMRAAFRAIPLSLYESARIDGASTFRVFRAIALPLLSPALITLGLLTFMWVWNDYFLAFVLISNPDLLPVTVTLGNFSTRYTVAINLTSAVSLLVAAPVLILYFVFQRKFIQGVLSGAVTG